MTDHSDLVAEMANVEKMPTGERLKHAKKKRTQQLKKFQQYEKQLEKDATKKGRRSLVPALSSGSGKAGGPGGRAGRKGNRSIRFVNNVILLEAAGRNDIDEVRQLLVGGVSANASNEDGLTALHQCCIDDSEDMMRLLVEHGADVNARDSELWTPLHAAGTCGHVHLCKYLIDNGAELLAVNADGNMPYDICEDELALDFIESEMAKRGVTQELIDSTRLCREAAMMNDLQRLARDGGDLEFRGRYGETPLHISAANGYLQVTQFLLDNHVSVDVLDNDTWQPIHCASCWGQLPVLELLLESGASLDAKTRCGDTPVDVCEDVELKHRMLEMKAEIENSRVNVSRELSRKRSVNIRSASIRRTSMREKKALSWKEAKEEALRLRENPSLAQNEEEDEDGSSKTSKSRLLVPVDTTSSQNHKNGDSNRLSNQSLKSASGDSKMNDHTGVHLASNDNTTVTGLIKEQRRRNSKYISSTKLDSLPSPFTNGDDKASLIPDDSTKRPDENLNPSPPTSEDLTLPDLKKQRIQQKQQRDSSKRRDTVHTLEGSDSCDEVDGHVELLDHTTSPDSRNGLGVSVPGVIYWETGKSDNGRRTNSRSSFSPNNNKTGRDRTGWCCTIV